MSSKQLLYLFGCLGFVAPVMTGCGNGVPTVNAGADAPAAVGRRFTMNPSAKDPDGDPVEYTWTMTGSPAGSTAVLEDTDISGASFVPDVIGDYQFSVTVTDGSDVSAPDSITVTARVPPSLVLTLNGAPFDPEEEEVTLMPVESAVLSASGSTVAPGLQKVYLWEVSELPDDVEYEISEDDSTMPSLTFTSTDTGIFELQVTVGDGDLEDEDNSFGTSETIVINVRNPPEAVINVTNPVFTDEEFILDGSESTVGPGGEAAYIWDLLSTPVGSLAALSSTTTATTTFTPDLPGTYGFSLVIDDGVFFSETTTVSVQATDR